MDCEKYLHDLNNLSSNFENPHYLFQHDYIRQMLLPIITIQSKLINVINEWKKAQQRSIITGIIDMSKLELIQKCNTIIMKLYLKLLKLWCMDHGSNFIDYIMEIKKQLHLLLQNAFVVIEQPCSSILKYDPLTIISNAKFEVKLCLLVHHQMITNFQDQESREKLESIDLRLLVEDEIHLLLSHGLKAIIHRKPSFNINKVKPKFTIENEMLNISMICQLKVDINRRGHNPKAIPVVEKKFKFIFWFTIKAFDELVVYTLSLPVNVLSRKDYRNSYATIIWDNAFPLENREMFETRDSVSWTELALVLNQKFHKDVGTFLKTEHLNFIYTMIPNRSESEHLDLITWEQFAKITLPMRQFTFFEWFYKILVLVREQLSKMYCDSLIHGFISSEMSENMLQECIDGTFLIRFSVTFCGAITISYVKNRKVEKLLPWDLDQLKKMSLTRNIKFMESLLYLYPNVPKDDAFGKYYSYNEITRSITGKPYCGLYNIVIREIPIGKPIGLFEM